MLKITGSSDQLAPKAFQTNNDEVFYSNDDRANETVMNSSKKLTHMPNIRATSKLNFLITNAKKTLNHL